MESEFEVLASVFSIVYFHLRKIQLQSLYSRHGFTLVTSLWNTLHTVTILVSVDQKGHRLTLYTFFVRIVPCVR